MPVRGIKTDKAELTKLNDLLESAFRNANNDHRFLKLHQQKPIENDWGRVYEYDPAIDKGLKLSEKKFVAFVGIYPQYMQYGKSKILNGGIRDVGSHPIARGKGYGTPTMNESLDFMRKREVDISILFSGANHFYENCGYRGGVEVPGYVMDSKSIIQFQKKLDQIKKSDTNANLNIILRPIEEKDFPAVNEILLRTSEDLFFAAHRTVDFWKKHFETNPNLKWVYLVIENGNEILGYMRYDLQQKVFNKVNLNINEWRLDFQGSKTLKANKGNESKIALKILNEFIVFVSEEAINEKDKIDCLTFHLSRSNRLIPLLKQEINLIDSNGYALSIMFIITNPYSLFNRLKEEIEFRNAQSKLPKGKFFIKFDKTEKFPGGVKIETINNKCDVSVTEDSKLVETWKKSIKDYAEFTDITSLTLFVAGIEHAEDVEPGDLEVVNIQGSARDWLIGLFSNVTYDHHEMDHY
jgi:GNAT superfamily N-acetyltransferase